jgi:hypothetical protein
VITSYEHALLALDFVVWRVRERGPHLVDDSTKLGGPPVVLRERSVSAP